MSDISPHDRIGRQHGSEVVHLLPQEIRTDDRYNVRPWANQGDAAVTGENRRIEQLAMSIERDGQIDDAVVRPLSSGSGEEHYCLFIGHRRRRAVALANERRSANGGGPLRLRCKVDRTGGDHFRRAIISNEQRENPSPMNRALLIKRIRAEHNWQGYPGAKLVAAYMGISPATVTQHERLLGPDISPELQQKVHDGTISVQSALEIIGSHLPLDAQLHVVERAVQVQKTNGHSKPEHVRHPAVRQALVDAYVLSRLPLPKTREEILTWLSDQDLPESYPPLRAWLRYLVDEWAEGTGSDSELQDRWDALTATPALDRSK